MDVWDELNIQKRMDGLIYEKKNIYEALRNKKY